MSNFIVCFVLNGLQDGDRDINALATDGTLLRDGWYYTIDGVADGFGPYRSREDAFDAGKNHGRPTLSVSQVFLSIAGGQFSRFKDNEGLWDGYAGASGDDLARRDENGIYILSTDDGRLVYEADSHDGGEANTFVPVGGVWELRD